MALEVMKPIVTNERKRKKVNRKERMECTKNKKQDRSAIKLLYRYYPTMLIQINMLPRPTSLVEKPRFRFMKVKKFQKVGL